MSPIPNPRVLFNSVPDGFPEPGKTVVYDASESIDLEAFAIPKGGFLVKTLYLSIDPYMRGRMRKDVGRVSYLPPWVLGRALYGHGVGVVVKSCNQEYPEDAHVYGFLNHQAFDVYDNSGGLQVIKNEFSLPWSFFLGVVGMPGKSAYHAWHEYSQAKEGDTLYVSAGAGPVGSLVVQLAKMDGCKVIASAGSDEKVVYMKTIGADVAFNYKTQDVFQALDKEGGIDIYWDNVGGATLDAALEAANVNARFIECGMISGYNTGGAPVKNLGVIMGKSISLYGFLVPRLEHKYDERFYQEIPKLVAEGKLEYREHVFQGLQSVGDALLAVQKGMNTAKAVVKVSDE